MKFVSNLYIYKNIANNKIRKMNIQEFSFGNFRSFKDINTLNLSAAKIKSKDKKIDINNVINQNDNISLLKSKAIYGANASGKSNIAKALVTFIRIINSSVKDEKVLYLIDSFKLSTETENEPSFFQMIFWINGIKYRYGFEANDKSISAEWLYSTPNQRELPLFIREQQEIIEIDKTNYLEGFKLVSLFSEDSNENEIFRDNSLFLSTVASFGFGKLSKELIESISSITVISGLGHQGMYKIAGDAINDVNKKKYIIDFLKNGDIGIIDIESVEITPDNFSDNSKDEIKKVFKEDEKKKLLLSIRKKFDDKKEVIENASFPFRLYESEGTQKLFELSPFIYGSLKNNIPIIIDEFDARFHPLLTKKIIELYNNQTNISSQLVFITHDTNLLSSELLRRDQIEFVEKDKYGASHLYSLVQFKGIRNNASFEKDYIQGKYGAIPFLGDFNKLINGGINA